MSTSFLSSPFRRVGHQPAQPAQQFKARTTEKTLKKRTASAAQKHFQGVQESKQNSRSQSLCGRISDFLVSVVQRIPILRTIVRLVARLFGYEIFVDRAGSVKASTGIEPLKRTKADSDYEALVDEVPKFSRYCFSTHPDVSITMLYTRPMELFLDALFQGSDIRSKRPGNGLHAFNQPFEVMLDYLNSLDGKQVIRIEAGSQGTLLFGGRLASLSDYLGKECYEITVDEVRNLLADQQVHLSPLLPKKFYLGLKWAMKADNVVTLCGSGRNPVCLQQLLNNGALYRYSNVQDFLRKVQENPGNFGFGSKTLSYEQILGLTIYQLGSMVVKTDAYRCFTDPDYKIQKRKLSENPASDTLKLVSLSGIRGLHSSVTTSVKGNADHELDRKIMTESFKVAFASSAPKGFAVLPAIGMGVWGGSSKVYWSALLEAIAENGDKLDTFFINPGHQRNGKGESGQEFAAYLREFKAKYPGNKNLEKVVNLYEKRTDLVPLAKKLKANYPERDVLLFNASDPDVTLGNHVGEYVLNINHPSTTEENFAALGSSSLCFEGLTGVLDGLKGLGSVEDTLAIDPGKFMRVH